MKSNVEKKLTPNQERALPLFAVCTSILEIAKQVGVNPKTVFEWLKQDHFKAEVEKLRNETFNESMNLLKSSANKAITTLLDLLSSKEEKTRLVAAKELLNFSFRSKETIELVERVSQLEEVANAKS